MITAVSKNNILIRLTDERKNHIFINHPETNKCISWIKKVITKKEKQHGNHKYF
jgi:hypothetical protein